MGRMTDEDIGYLLREAPLRDGEAPSSDLTRRVLERLDRRLEDRRRRPARLRAVGFGFALALLGAALVTGNYIRERMERSKTEDRVRELRTEYRDLQREFDKLRALTREIQPVLDLGGTEQVDFVLDLRELARERGSGERPDAAPASHSTSRDDARDER